MKALKPGSFGHRGCLGKKVEAKEANRVSAKCAIVLPMLLLCQMQGIGN
jgi:hypothetical protein